MSSSNCCFLTCIQISQRNKRQGEKERLNPFECRVPKNRRRDKKVVENAKTQALPQTYWTRTCIFHQVSWWFICTWRFRSTNLNHPRYARIGYRVMSGLNSRYWKAARKRDCFSYLQYTGIIISCLHWAHTCRQRSNLPLRKESTHVPPQACIVYLNLVLILDDPDGPQSLPLTGCRFLSSTNSNFSFSRETQTFHSVSYSPAPFSSLCSSSLYIFFFFPSSSAPHLTRLLVSLLTSILAIHILLSYS